MYPGYVLILNIFDASITMRGKLKNKDSKEIQNMIVKRFIISEHMTSHKYTSSKTSFFHHIDDAEPLLPAIYRNLTNTSMAGGETFFGDTAYVLGNGSSTVAELAEARDRFVQSQNSKNRLQLDEVSYELLREQELELDSVPGAGREVRLKKIVNVGQGGHVIDVTDSIHPLYGDWIARIARRFGLSVFALDVITEDPGADPLGASRVIEVNGAAQWLHHTFSEGRTHDIATLVLRDLLSVA